MQCDRCNNAAIYSDSQFFYDEWLCGNCFDAVVELCKSVNIEERPVGDLIYNALQDIGRDIEERIRIAERV